jgi:hypothetical protein
MGKARSKGIVGNAVKLLVVRGVFLGVPLVLIAPAHAATNFGGAFITPVDDPAADCGADPQNPLCTSPPGEAPPGDKPPRASFRPPVIGPPLPPFAPPPRLPIYEAPPPMPGR